ncbi:MAG: topoisomerase C-terminal repeat-containing protein [Pirellulales bacterium]
MDRLQRDALLEQHLTKLVDYQFTAEMEDLLDAISRKETGGVDYLNQFYFGNGTPGLKAQLETKLTEVDPREMGRFSLGTPTEGPSEEVFVRVGKFGPFLEQGTRKASIPEGLCPDEINLPKALELLNQASIGEEPLGICPETNRPVYLKQGRFGTYVQLAPEEEGGTAKNASLLAGMKPEDVTLEVALRLLTLPRNLGVHPELNEPVMAFNGKFGPYIKCGTETRSLPKEVSPLDVTMDQAKELLAQPKARGRGRGAAQEPLKTFDPSPVTNQPIKLLSGRYGAYVADGETNASLPKDMDPATLTMEQAVMLLAQRAAMGPPKKKAKRPTKKAAAPKAAKKAKTAEAAPKKAAKKKTAKKTAKKAAAEADSE